MMNLDQEKNMSCIFPNDLQDYQWYSLNHTIEMFITNDNIEFRNSQIKKRFHCLQELDSSNYRIRAFTNWYKSSFLIERIIYFLFISDVKVQCLKIIRRATNILELILTNCDDNQSNQTFVFLRKTDSYSSCPISIGHLLLESNLNHHHSEISKKNLFQISVGCEKKEKLMIYQTDRGKTSNFFIYKNFEI